MFKNLVYMVEPFSNKEPVVWTSIYYWSVQMGDVGTGGRQEDRGSATVGLSVLFTSHSSVHFTSLHFTSVHFS